MERVLGKRRKTVAIKTSHPAKEGLNPRESLEQEYRHLNQLQGVRHLVRVFGALQDRANYQIVMENGGPTLKSSIVQGNAFLFPEALHILKDLLEFHIDMAKKNYIHGDLTIANVLRKAGVTTVVDLGAAQCLDTDRKSPLTSIGFCAPEILLRKSLDPSCDLWSIGCIAYVLITGHYFVPPDLWQDGEKVLFHLVKTIGMPSRHYLGERWYAYVRMNQPGFHSFRNELIDSLNRQGVAGSLAQHFVLLMEGILRFENRLSAEEALRQCQWMLARVQSIASTS